MNIGKEIVNKLLIETHSIIGLYPGAFCPPHRGHLEVVKRASDKLDEVQVIISNKGRGGYTPQISKLIWEEYTKDIPNVSILISKTNTPVTEVYKTIKDKTSSYIVLFGKGEEDRFKAINENREKYDNAEVMDAGKFGDYSATKLREAIKVRDIKTIQSLIPENISVIKFLSLLKLNEIKIEKPFPINKWKKILLDLANNEYRSGKLEHKNLVQIHKLGKKIHSKESLIDFMSVYPGLEDDVKNDWEFIEDLLNTAEKLNNSYLNENIDESKQVGDLYHFTHIKSIKRILQLNKLESSQTYPSNDERDFQFYGKDEKEYENGEENRMNVNLNFISTTRDKLLYLKSPSIGGFNVRITLDGNKISHKYKIKPFYYYKGEWDNHNDRTEQDEAEERIDMGKDEALSNLENYIKQVDIILDDININSGYYMDILTSISQKYPYVKFLYNEKPITLEEFIELKSNNQYEYEEDDELYENIIKDSIKSSLNEIKVNSPSPFKKGKMYEVPRFGGTYDVCLYVGMNNSKTGYIFKDQDSTFVIGKKSNKDIKPYLHIDEIKINKPFKNWVEKHNYYLDKIRNEFHEPTTEEQGMLYSFWETQLDWVSEAIKFNSAIGWLTSEEAYNYLKSGEYKNHQFPEGDDDIPIEEIKVNKPGLNFPIKVTSQEQAQKIGKQLIDKGYTFNYDSKIDLNNSPFKTNHFFPFTLMKMDEWGDKKVAIEPIIEIKQLNEVFDGNKHQNVIYKAIDYVCNDLQVEKPEIELINDPEYTNQHSSFGGYVPSEKKVYAVVYNRNTADIMRSIAHELFHYKQDLDGRLTLEAGEDGDEFENEANSYSGKIMREIGRKFPGIFENENLNEIKINKPKKFEIHSETSTSNSRKIEKEYILWNKQKIYGEWLVDENNGNVNFYIYKNPTYGQAIVEEFYSKFQTLIDYDDESLFTFHDQYINMNHSDDDLPINNPINEIKINPPYQKLEVTIIDEVTNLGTFMGPEKKHYGKRNENDSFWFFIEKEEHDEELDEIKLFLDNKRIKYIITHNHNIYDKVLIDPKYIKYEDE